jgi:hypothetical protein
LQGSGVALAGGIAVQVQLNTDNHLVGSDDLALKLEAEVRDALGRFAGRITRVEVHLNDVNSGKAGTADKRCMMEARVAGRQPASVTHHAPSVELAIKGAAEKLASLLERVSGKEARK